MATSLPILEGITERPSPRSGDLLPRLLSLLGMNKESQLARTRRITSLLEDLAVEDPRMAPRYVHALSILRGHASLEDGDEPRGGSTIPRLDTIIGGLKTPL